MSDGSIVMVCAGAAILCYVFWLLGHLSGYSSALKDTAEYRAALECLIKSELVIRAEQSATSGEQWDTDTAAVKQGDPK